MKTIEVYYKNTVVQTFEVTDERYDELFGQYMEPVIETKDIMRSINLINTLYSMGFDGTYGTTIDQIETITFEDENEFNFRR